MRHALTAFLLFLASRLLALAFTALLLMAASAQAQTVGLHLASAHSRPGFSSSTPGAYVMDAAGWTLGAYRNSFRVLTIYTGRTWSTEAAGVQLAVTAAAASGYNSPVIIVPTIAVPVGSIRARAAVMPATKSGEAWAAHLSVETQL